ncbi:MAG: hypothetical protein HZA01_17125 [Nitrospinae bacterium]|nr:hypothetical protein [Nitrospinota bacterium]
MAINKAIEEIRKTRHEISSRHHHNTKELLEHYKQLESKYSDRICDRTRDSKIIQRTLKSSAVD